MACFCQLLLEVLVLLIQLQDHPLESPDFTIPLSHGSLNLASNLLQDDFLRNRNPRA
jgi:hypothetical protein